MEETTAGPRQTPPTSSPSGDHGAQGQGASPAATGPGPASPPPSAPSATRASLGEEGGASPSKRDDDHVHAAPSHPPVPGSPAAPAAAAAATAPEGLGRKEEGEAAAGGGAAHLPPLGTASRGPILTQTAARVRGPGSRRPMSMMPTAPSLHLEPLPQPPSSEQRGGAGQRSATEAGEPSNATSPSTSKGLAPLPDAAGMVERVRMVDLAATPPASSGSTSPTTVNPSAPHPTESKRHPVHGGIALPGMVGPGGFQMMPEMLNRARLRKSMLPGARTEMGDGAESGHAESTPPPSGGLTPLESSGIASNEHPGADVPGAGARSPRRSLAPVPHPTPSISSSAAATTTAEDEPPPRAGPTDAATAGGALPVPPRISSKGLHLPPFPGAGGGEGGGTGPPMGFVVRPEMLGPGRLRKTGVPLVAAGTNPAPPPSHLPGAGVGAEVPAAAPSTSGEGPLPFPATRKDTTLAPDAPAAASPSPKEGDGPAAVSELAAPAAPGENVVSDAQIPSSPPVPTSETETAPSAAES